MPTPHQRLQVIEDPELTRAIDGVRDRLGQTTSRARVVRDLALRGWHEIEDEDRRHREAADAFTALMDEGAFDWAALEELRRIDAEPR